MVKSRRRVRRAMKRSRYFMGRNQLLSRKRSKRLRLYTTLQATLGKSPFLFTRSQKQLQLLQSRLLLLSVSVPVHKRKRVKDKSKATDKVDAPTQKKLGESKKWLQGLLNYLDDGLNFTNSSLTQMPRRHKPQVVNRGAKRNYMQPIPRLLL